MKKSVAKISKHDMEENSNIEHSEISDNKPHPTNIIEFLPWAVKQLHLEYDVQLLVNKQDPYINIDVKGKNQKKEFDVVISSISIQDIREMEIGVDDSVVRVTAIFNALDQLVELKFIHNKVPCSLIKLIGLIAQYHPSLNSITMSKGIDSHTIHEISQFLPSSFITDICFDGYFFKEANYHLLLECGKLRYLSISRCNITDDVVEILSSKLVFRKPLLLASTGLIALNLSCNVITDRGATALANMLRTNRSIGYLNLAGNQITDVGAGYILNVLTHFPMTTYEIMAARAELRSYLLHKREIIDQCISKLQGKQILKKKPLRAPVVRNKGKSEFNEEIDPYAAAIVAKAEEMAVSLIGVNDHPFSKENTISKDGVLYCKGNNCLNYLSLAYNNLSVFFLKQLHRVLATQKRDDRRPRGLANVSVEGNPLPEHCAELKLIDMLLINNFEDTKNQTKGKTSLKRKLSVA